MKNYEVLFSDGHIEMMSTEEVSELIDELELFERDDVEMIHTVNELGDIIDTVWTEEEGLFISDF